MYIIGVKYVSAGQLVNSYLIPKLAAIRSKIRTAANGPDPGQISTGLHSFKTYPRRTVGQPIHRHKMIHQKCGYTKAGFARGSYCVSKFFLPFFVNTLHA